MTAGELIVYLVVAMCCGCVGQALAGRSLGGWVVSTVVGLAGAVLGSFLARTLAMPEPLSVRIGDQSVPLLWTVVGAALVTLGVSYMRRGARRREA